MDTDLDYQELIRDRSNYFPSPSVFVYTLPNILIGEICIRHKIRGENAFFVSEGFDPGQITDYVTRLFEQGNVNACICGWVELLREEYRSCLFTVEKASRETGEPAESPVFNSENISNIFYK
jgi:hypothetical protein